MAITNKNSAVAPFGGIDNGFPEIYTAHLHAILADGTEIDLRAPLPENYQFSLSTSFDNPFNQPLSQYASSAVGGAAGVAIDAFSTGTLAAAGKSTMAKWMSGAVWTGGSMFEITVPFVIQAFEDTRQEVVKTMRDMLKLVAPGEAGVMLQAPGPNMLSAAGKLAGDNITISIGTFFVMNPCVIESVSCDFDTQMDVDGSAPLSATITVTAQSFFSTTKQDLDKYFKV